jgi:pimeloyl-ACP methyl ester carboxylesterase
LPKVRIPILILHSREDRLIGYQHSERNFAAANEPKLFFEIKGGHNDPLADKQAFLNAVEKLLQLVESSAATAQSRTVGKP